MKKQQYGMEARRILANNIVYFRMKKGWTQEEFADILGTTPNYVSSLENAKRNARVDYIGYIAKKLNISIEQLFIERPPVACRRMPKRS